jgi:hypothetical protein
VCSEFLNSAPRSSCLDSVYSQQKITHVFISYEEYKKAAENSYGISSLEEKDGGAFFKQYMGMYYTPFMKESAHYAKGYKKCLQAFNKRDTSFKEICDITYENLYRYFTYKNSLYLLLKENDSRYVRLIQISNDSLDKMKNDYKIKKFRYSIPDGSKIDLDKKGNLRVLVEHYESCVNIWAIIFFWARGVGRVIDLDRHSLQAFYYVFDENLNLLYTQPYYPEKEK